MDGDRAHRSVSTERALAVASAFVAALVHASAAAQEADASRVELWLSDAPLTRVLEQIATRDGIDVVVGSDIDDRVDGRLDGPAELVLATLAVEHGLSVHASGDTVWFDRKTRPVVSLVRLAPAEAMRALAALEPTLDAGSVAQRTDGGLVLSGSRAFVEETRRRMASLASPTSAVADTADSPIADAPSSGAIRSVWDIPGYDVDYAAEDGS